MIASGILTTKLLHEIADDLLGPESKLPPMIDYEAMQKWFYARRCDDQCHHMIYYYPDSTESCQCGKLKRVKQS